MKILILCTGNSCRSQMAEGFLRSFDKDLEVFSAGTKPAKSVHPIAVQVMSEAGVDISGAFPKNVDRFPGQSFDYVITVCSGAAEDCPVFIGNVGRRLHIGFPDPAAVRGSHSEVRAEFRRIRDDIREKFYQFYKSFAK